MAYLTSSARRKSVFFSSRCSPRTYSWCWICIKLLSMRKELPKVSVMFSLNEPVSPGCPRLYSSDVLNFSILFLKFNMKFPIRFMWFDMS